MTDPRLRGQEVEIQVVTGGETELSIGNIGSFNWTEKFEKKEDGFLGEVTNRYDDIYNGVDGTFDMQVSKQDWTLFQEKVKDRAKRITPNLVINIVCVQFYANGETPTFTFPDVKFGPNPVETPARGDFVKVRWDFSCSDVNKDTQALL